jgi:hypothetical protein
MKTNAVRLLDSMLIDNRDKSWLWAVLWAYAFSRGQYV